MNALHLPSFPPRPRHNPLLRTALAVGAGAALGAFLSGFSRQLRAPERSVRAPIDPAYAAGDEQFRRTMGQLLHPPILPGNRVTTLLNGDRIFPAMLDAIRSARHTINMETFIYWSGRVGQSFADAFIDRARAGVRCHLLLDWLGSNKLDDHSLRAMQEAGVQVTRYHRNIYHLAHANHRTHRKLLIVDGQIGFTGGVGIADEWAGNAQDADHWRDNHYQIEGPVVAQLQAAFTDNWLKSQHIVLHDQSYFPPLSPVGDLHCQVFQSSPDEGSESMRLMYLLAIAAARKAIHIGSAYFVPDPIAIDALIQARHRGVDVEVIVPGQHIDISIVRHASRARWGHLLRAGVRIFEYQPTMYHTKVMVVDGLWTSIGSTNFDNRSFRLNDEANLNVYDHRFACEQLNAFDLDKSRSREITLDHWNNRPPWRKLADRAAETLSSQL